MRRLFTVVVILVIGAAVLYVVGPGLPEGNPLHAVGSALRSLGENMADGFGGGYTQGPATP